MTYTADLNQKLIVQAKQLAEQLKQSTLEDCEKLLTRFSLELDASVSILGQDGRLLKGIETRYMQEMEDNAKITAKAAGTRYDEEVIH